ncbi:MAG: PAS domain-containing protein, partial [Janthinobacterium lividum]
MQFSSFPIEETLRIAALHRLAILDTPAEVEFDDITRLVAGTCATPISLISLLDSQRQWSKSAFGPALPDVPADRSLCKMAMASSELIEVFDTRLDPRFADLPLVIGSAAVRFYAAAPLLTTDGFCIGALCVLDHVPRQLDGQQRDALATLARMVMRQMEARLLAMEHRCSINFMETLIDQCPVGISAKKIHKDRSNGTGVITFWNPAAAMMTGVSAESILGQNNHSRLSPARAAANAAHERQVLESRRSVTVPVYPVAREDGETRLLRMTSIPLFDSDGEVEFIITIGEDNTELLDQQKALRRSHAELAAINDALPLGLFHTDARGACSYLNRSAEIITGLSIETGRGLGWLRAVHADDIEQVQRDFFVASKQQRLYQGDIRFVLPDGSIVKARTRAAPFSVDGVFSGFVGTLDDITEREALSRSVAVSERRLRLVMDNIPALVTHVDRDLKLLYMNPMGTTLFNMLPERIVGKPIVDVYPAAALGHLLPQIGKVVKGQTVTFEVHVNEAGVDRYFQSTYVPDRDEHGLVVGFFGMAFNITARKQAELQLSENEKRLRMITDNLPMAITYMDHAHCYRFANATTQTWFKSRGPVHGQRAEEVLGHSEYYENLGFMQRALGGERVDFEKPPSDSQPRYQHITYLPDMSADGEVMGIYTISNDISALKRNEETLQQMARYDMLTGLPNRGHLYETLDAALARCIRAGTPIAVMFLDIDHFKQINDTLGHARGDLVLKEFSRRLEASVRGTDTVARLAGDEFVIVLEGVRTIKDANLVAAKVIEQVGKPWVLNGERLKVSTSIGVVYDEHH